MSICLDVFSRDLIQLWEKLHVNVPQGLDESGSTFDAVESAHSRLPQGPRCTRDRRSWRRRPLFWGEPMRYLSLVWGPGADGFVGDVDVGELVELEGEFPPGVAAPAPGSDPGA